MPTITTTTSTRPLLSRRWLVEAVARRLETTGRVVCLATAQSPAQSSRWYVVDGVTLERRQRQHIASDADEAHARVHVMAIVADDEPGAYTLEELVHEAAAALDGVAMLRTDVAPSEDHTVLHVTGIDESEMSTRDDNSRIRMARLTVHLHAVRRAGRTP